MAAKAQRKSNWSPTDEKNWMICRSTQTIHSIMEFGLVIIWCWDFLRNADACNFIIFAKCLMFMSLFWSSIDNYLSGMFHSWVTSGSRMLWMLMWGNQDWMEFYEIRFPLLLELWKNPNHIEITLKFSKTIRKR